MASEIEEITAGQLKFRFLVGADDSNGKLSVFEVDVPSGAKVPAPHSHDAFEETIYGLEGVITFTVDGVDHHLGSGQALTINRGVIHGFVNATDDDVKFLVIVTPAVFGAPYFRDLAKVMPDSGSGPPDPAAIHEVMKKHGLTPAND